MTISGFRRISLLNPDPELVREDTAAKSVAFFARVRPVLVDRILCEELKQVSTRRDGSNVRLCLHSVPEDDQHDMIILIRKGTLLPPHRHPGKAETFHVMEGRLGMFSFSADGNAVEAGVLHAGEVYRFSPAHYHTVVPLDEFVIYHESRIGPFLGEKDRVFPEWGPRLGDVPGMNRFFDRCMALLGAAA